MRLALVLTLAFCSCATSQSNVSELSRTGIFGPRDYLKTAWETLVASETDTNGHRIKAQQETRAALDEMGEISTPARRVPFSGEPSLTIALELLEQSQLEMDRSSSPDALAHARRAADELRAAIASK